MTRYGLTLTFVFLGSLLSASAMAQQPDETEITNWHDQKHKTCLERIAEDQEQALEEAMIWRDQGGGRRARHCEAMALFALGHEAEAAFRLDGLADGADGGSKEMRVNFRNEAANFWLAANQPEKAYQSATEGLELDRANADLRITRARAYAMSGQLDFAETDLTNVLKLHPNHAEALRYRADAKFRQDRLDAAKIDIEAALAADPSSIETALLRGKINEALRLAN